MNKAILIGNVGGDPETRVTTNNLEITKFGLATSRNWKNKDGEWQNETTWHNIVAFNLSQYYKDAIKKGRKLCIEGRISKNDYVDKDNVKRYSTEIIAENIVIIEPKSEDSGESYIKESQQPFAEASSEDDLPF